jgi:hypothetical protein
VNLNLSDAAVQGVHYSQDNNEEEKQIRHFTLNLEEGVRIKTLNAIPLVLSHWGQGEPYWGDCPKLESRKSYVGCVATAMAQIMRYHSWPDRGLGSYSYLWSNGQQKLFADFSNHYDWNNMPYFTEEIDTETEKNAVSELSYECAVSVRMNFDPDGSATSTSRVASAMAQYFKYSDKIKVVFRQDYAGKDAWFDVMKRERDELRPLQLAIHKEDGGHSVVVDGYIITETSVGQKIASSRQVHINMGWDGNSDYWYDLDGILDYTNIENQYAIINIISPAYRDKPRAPKRLKAVARPSVAVKLRWKDKSKHEEGFKIERKVAEDLHWQEIAVTKTNRKKYIDREVKEDTLYKYRVCAFNLVGPSAYTKVTKVRTRARAKK